MGSGGGQWGHAAILSVVAVKSKGLRFGNPDICALGYAWLDFKIRAVSEILAA